MTSSVEECVEAASRSAIISAGALKLAGNVTAVIRCFTFNDSTLIEEEEEPREFPAVGIMWHPYFTMDRPRGPTLNVSIDVMCATHCNDDPKRLILLALYKAVRAVFDTADFVPAFAGTRFQYHACSIMQDGGPPILDDNMQALSFPVLFYLTKIA